MEIVAHLGLAMKSVKKIARTVNRPVEDVDPILASLAERMLIVGLTKRKVFSVWAAELLSGIV